MRLPARMQRDRRLVDAALRRFLPSRVEVPLTVRRAMVYSLFPGGKRLRPILAITAVRACTVAAMTPSMSGSEAGPGPASAELRARLGFYILSSQWSRIINTSVSTVRRSGFACLTVSLSGSRCVFGARREDNRTRRRRFG